MTTTHIKLDPPEIIMDRLKAMDPSQYNVERLYPKFTRIGGREKFAMGVVIDVQLAIEDYVSNTSEMMRPILYEQTPSFIGAIIGPNNKEALDEALAFLVAAIAATDEEGS